MISIELIMKERYRNTLMYIFYKYSMTKQVLHLCYTLHITHSITLSSFNSKVGEWQCLTEVDSKFPRMVRTRCLLLYLLWQAPDVMLTVSTAMSPLNWPFVVAEIPNCNNIEFLILSSVFVCWDIIRNYKFCVCLLRSNVHDTQHGWNSLK